MKNEQIKLEDYRAGALITVVRQVVGDKNAKIFDYFPHHQEVKKVAKTSSPSAEEIRQNMRAFIEAQEKYGVK